MPREERKDTKNSKDKIIISKYKLLQKLWENLRQTTIKIELNPPRRAGWEKTLVLREDVAKRPDASHIKKCLSFINSKAVNTKEKVFFIRDDNFNLIPYILQPKYIEIAKWEKEILPTLLPVQQGMFEKTIVVEKHWKSNVRKEVIVFKTPWMFVEEITPHYEYFDIIEDSDLRYKVDRLNDELYYHEPTRSRLYHLMSWRQDKDWYTFEDKKEKLLDPYLIAQEEEIKLTK